MIRFSLHILPDHEIRCLNPSIASEFVNTICFILSRWSLRISGFARSRPKPSVIPACVLSQTQPYPGRTIISSAEEVLVDRTGVPRLAASPITIGAASEKEGISRTSTAFR